MRKSFSGQVTLFSQGERAAGAPELVGFLVAAHRIAVNVGWRRQIERAILGHSSDQEEANHVEDLII